MFLIAPLIGKSIIKFEKSAINFGELEPGEMKNFSYSFANAGDSVLIISDVSGSCGCLAPILEKKEFQPGEKGELIIRFNSVGLNGKISKYIIVRSNDETAPAYQLELAGNLVLKNFSNWELSEDRFEMKGLKLLKKYTKEIKITNTGNIDLMLLETSHSPDTIVEIEKSNIHPKETGKIFITYKPMEVGLVSKFISIRTNSATKRNLVIQLTAETVNN